jgi:hypothetical protein
MDGFNINKIPKVHFVFDLKGPGGFIPLGYTKYTLPYVMQLKFDDINDREFTGYYPSVYEPNIYNFNRTAGFSTYICEYTKNIDSVLTCEIKDEIKHNEFYVIPLESLNVNNLFEYYSHPKFDLDDFFSPILLDLFKTHSNFKLLIMDSGEGAYPHTTEFYEKVNTFLNKHSITDENKVIISTNNNLIEDIKQDKIFESFKNRIDVYPNNYLLLTAGRFISELRVQDNKLIENDYEFSIQQKVLKKQKEKYFLMYNRNSERMHRPYFVNKLYKENLLEKGYVSFFENEYFDSFLQSSKEYPPLGLTFEDIKDIKEHYKNYYPLTIDETDSQRVSDFHNFLSRKNEYENSYFTIVSETNAESEYCFITEKTVKPLMNLHPFLVLGNPFVLRSLRKYGFKTFDKWWDESYDEELDFKKRANMVFEITKQLCNKSHEEWIQMLTEMENLLMYNKNILHKLTTGKQFQIDFLNKIGINANTKEII